MSIIPFPSAPKKDESYLVGPCICFKCKHEWIGLHPVGCEIVECPNCGCSGVKKGTVFREEFQYQCNCGCNIYRINKHGPYCIDCGEYSTGWF